MSLQLFSGLTCRGEAAAREADDSASVGDRHDRQKAVGADPADILTALAEQLFTGRDVRQLAQATLTAARALTGAEHGFVSAIDPQTHANVGHTLTAMMEHCQVASAERSVAFPIGADGRYAGLWGHALNTREPFFTNHPRRHPNALGLPPGHVPLECYLGVPILAEGELLGLIALANAPGGFDEADVRAVSRVARLHGAAFRALGEPEVAPAVSPDPPSAAGLRSVFVEMQDGFALHELVYIDGVAVDYRFLEVNPAFEQLVGLTARELVGRTLREVFPAVESKWVERYAAVVESGTTAHFTDFSAALGRHFEVTAYRSAPGCFATLVRDVTERLRQEAERRSLEAQLRQSQKLEALGTLAGGLAHDFNNLLTGILASAALCSTEDLAPDLQASLDDISEAGRRAAELTRHLLAFARKQVAEPQVSRLDRIVEGLERMLRRLLGEDIVLETRHAPDLGQVRVDRGQLEQVLMNLVVNSRHAMPRGGHIVIESANVTVGVDLARAVPDVVPGEYVVVVVADDGVGMDAETQRRAFEPFFTTKPREQGTGLGLAMVYGIVRQHGGFLDLWSEPGCGTIFRLYFPRVEATESSVTSRTAPPTSRAIGGQTVLVVEDEPIVRRVALRILKQAGYRVLEAAAGDDALRLAREHLGPIHLLLTDVVMPGMSGVELAEHLERERPDLRTLFVSGYAPEVLDRHGALREGVRLLMKPYCPGALSAMVAEVLGGQRVCLDGPSGNP